MRSGRWRSKRLAPLVGPKVLRDATSAAEKERGRRLARRLTSGSRLFGLFQVSGPAQPSRKNKLQPPDRSTTGIKRVDSCQGRRDTTIKTTRRRDSNRRLAAGRGRFVMDRSGPPWLKSGPDADGMGIEGGRRCRWPKGGL